MAARNIEEGRALGHALTFCSVLGQAACPIAYLAGDLEAATRYGAMLIEHTERYPARLWQSWARCFSGMVMIKRGDGLDGLALLRDALPLGELASALGAAGEIARGLATVDETLAHCKARNEGWYLAELLRIKGELLLRQTGDESVASAEACFAEALETAGQQGARFWALRSALSLARMKIGQHQPEEARRAVTKVYEGFTEGFGTADLRAAKALLGV